MPTVLVARTDALSATLLTSDVDPADEPFLTGERTPEGFFRRPRRPRAAIARGLAYAPYADLVWFETSTPDMGEAREFAQAIHERVPGQAAGVQLLAVLQLERAPRRRRDRRFQNELAELGYRFQFVTLAGLHSLNAAHVRARARLRARGHERLRASCRTREFALEEHGYTATRHQREVGTGYFDAVAQAITGGECSTLALEGSTEAAQFRS